MAGLLRFARAPIMTVSLALGGMLVILVLACISVGGWIQGGLGRLGARSLPGGLLIVLGVTAYSGLGVIAPAYLGYLLIGWIGAVIGPLAILAVIVILDRW